MSCGLRRWSSAKQLRVPASDLGFYDWSGRSIKRHRAEIREALGFREWSVADADKLTNLLVTNVTQTEPRADQVCADLLMQCREEGIEPPTPVSTGSLRSALHALVEALRVWPDDPPRDPKGWLVTVSRTASPVPCWTSTPRFRG